MRYHEKTFSFLLVPTNLTNEKKCGTLIDRINRMDVKTMQTVLQNLSFSLNATIPVFLMMVFGGLMKKVNLLDDHTTGKLNQFVFKRRQTTGEISVNSQVTGGRPTSPRQARISWA